MNVSKNPLRSVPLAVDHLQNMWRRVVQKYFDDRLPPIIIEWSFRLTASTGMFVSQVGPRSQRVSKEERHGAARRIRLSAPLLRAQPEAEIFRTLAHEIIHQWQYDVRKRFPNHGQDFQGVMARMNRDGMGITVRHSLNQEVEQFSKYLWRCLACGTSYRRQRRTISSRRHRCGSCQGRLEEIVLETPELNQPTLYTPGPFRLQCTVQASREMRPQQLSFNF